MKEFFPWLMRQSLILPGTLVIVFTLTGHLQDHTNPATLLMILSACILMLNLILLHPFPAGFPPGLLRPVTGAATVTAAMLFLWMTPVAPPGALRDILPLAAGVAVIGFCFASLAGLLARLSGNDQEGAWWALCLLATLMTIPFWISPPIELWHPGNETIDTLIALCPLSYLAVLSDWDYLRFDGVYRHSILGGLRYEYPNPVTTSVSYLALGILFRYAHLILKTVWSTEKKLLE
ncbi:MAG: hypothetical protein GY703_20955 [Gammaproteobacteria bacterium]|nr:hypothetical protein [Gammaproteobacteria bacterium]